jgi:hypothetical protein
LRQRIRNEPHIEHPVGFIEHEKFHVAEPQRVARCA